MVEPFQSNDATDAGNRLEGAVIDWACNRLGVLSAERQVFLRHAEHDWMGATLDVRATLPSGERTVIEAKTGGITSRLNEDAWGAEYTDDIPEQYLCQVQHQMAVAGPEYQRAFVAALLPPRGFQLFVVERDDAAIAALIKVEHEFWHKNLKERVAPDSLPTLKVIKRRKRAAGKECDISDTLVGNVVILKDQIKNLEKQLDQAEAELLAAMNDAEVGNCMAWKVTYREQTRKAYSVGETKFRTLRITER